MSRRQAIVIGAGPAGLTAAHELLARTDVHPVVLEADDVVGGIARTVAWRGNRIDIGGHRFFSKSERVLQWWFQRLPLQRLEAESVPLAYQGRRLELHPPDGGPDPEATEAVMLLRARKSRILHRRHLFDYPLTPSLRTLQGLGLARTASIGLSYLHARLHPVRPERNLEDFLVNRFGRVLYQTFFRDYTQKVWGVPCSEIDPAWGAQRIRGLSIASALRHAVRRALRPGAGADARTETSLLERFLYPKRGPGQLWELVADDVARRGGEIHLGWRVTGLDLAGSRIRSVTACSSRGESRTWHCDHVLSTMPLRDLVAAVTGPVPDRVCEVAQGLSYRDFLTVGLLLRRLSLRDRHVAQGQLVKDNWIYVQETDVQVGRIQIFNNWSPWMVADPRRVWIGLEYFCQEGDEIWSRGDAALQDLAAQEVVRLGLAKRADVLGGTVVRMPKSYPAYLGTYDRFSELREWLDGVTNLFPVGRNGMHRYNNQDHSMLVAMVAVDQIAAGQRAPQVLWAVNADAEYHEEGDAS